MPTLERSRRLIDGVWRWVTADESGGGGSLPSGGSTGEVLTKESNADGDVGWEAGGGSQAFRIVSLPIAFNTPGLVIPASGPAGIHIADVEEFEALCVLENSDTFPLVRVMTAWDGSTPQLNVCTTAGRGNLPGTPPVPFDYQGELVSVDADDTSTGAFQSKGSINLDGTFWFSPATSLYAYIDDGAGNDPGSTQGIGVVTFLIQAAFS